MRCQFGRLVGAALLVLGVRAEGRPLGIDSHSRLNAEVPSLGPGRSWGDAVLHSAVEVSGGTDSNYLQGSGPHPLGEEATPAFYKSSARGHLRLQWPSFSRSSAVSDTPGFTGKFDGSFGHRWIVPANEEGKEVPDQGHWFADAQLNAEWSATSHLGLYTSTSLRRQREPEILPDTNLAYARQTFDAEGGVTVPAWGLKLGYRHSRARFLGLVHSRNNNRMHSAVLHWSVPLAEDGALFVEGQVGRRKFESPLPVQANEKFETIGVGARFFPAQRWETMGAFGYTSRRYSRGSNVSAPVGRLELSYHALDIPRAIEQSIVGGQLTIVAGAERDVNHSYLGNFFQRFRGYFVLKSLVGNGVRIDLESAFSQVQRPTTFFQDGTLEFKRLTENRLTLQALGELPIRPDVSVNATAKYHRNYSGSVVFSDPDGLLVLDSPALSRFQFLVGLRWAI